MLKPLNSINIFVGLVDFSQVLNDLKNQKWLDVDKAMRCAPVVNEGHRITQGFISLSGYLFDIQKALSKRNTYVIDNDNYHPFYLTQFASNLLDDVAKARNIVVMTHNGTFLEALCRCIEEYEYQDRCRLYKVKRDSKSGFSYKDFEWEEHYNMFEEFAFANECMFGSYSNKWFDNFQDFIKK